jgi:hypothetical protein
MVLASFIVLILVMTLPCKVLEFPNDKYEVITPVVKAGGEVTYRMQYEKFKPFVGTASKQLINDIVYSYLPAVGQASVGITDKEVTLEIPDYISPGIYFIRTVYTYKVNALKTVTYTHDTVTFEVVR